MTRRITWIILLTVWATFIAIGLTAYFTVRAVMLRHLDHALMDQMMQPRVEDYQGRKYQILGGRHEGDITRIRSGSMSGEPHAQPISKQWIRRPGEEFRRRSITARVYAQPVDGGEPEWIVLNYSRQAYEFDPFMNQLATALIIATGAGGVIAAVLARIAAITSLRPLRATANVIGTIDDRSLNRRIDASQLPSELVPMAEKLNGMLQRLERSMEQRRLFLADASHELRTPVAALMSALELSARRPRDLDYYRKLIDDCLVDVRHLRRLVEALMTQVKSERPAHEDDWETTDLARLINECLAIVGPLAEKKSVRLTRSSSTGEPIGALRTQPTRLRSVLINLLANAIEHNRASGIVEVICEQVPDAVEIAVRDTGEGIVPEHLPHLFEPFYRADRAREASEHMGLGLFLVHSHVRELGGTCTVESTVGVGTTFRVRLPGIAVPIDAPAPSASPGVLATARRSHE